MLAREEGGQRLNSQTAFMGQGGWEPTLPTLTNLNLETQWKADSMKGNEGLWTDI